MGISSALAAPAKVTVRVSVVVIDDLVRKPVPLTNFRVFPAYDSSAAQIVRSDEDGVCVFSLMPGNYRFQSVAPLSFKDRVLSWSMPFVVNTDETQNVLFTDSDAADTGSALPTVAVSSSRNATGKVEVAEGTKIRLSLGQQLTSNRSKKGDEVRFFMKDALLGSNGEILIKSGASATGAVTYAKGAGGFGKKGKLEFSIESITGADGTQIPLRSSQTAHGKSNILGGPVGIILVAPIMGFIKGKNTRLDVGTQYDAFIDKATWVAPLATATK
ncbi:hypothetical protein [Abditibacterium utsteinense]|uniref:hypothetical protein n=1 Tax=Abditibacterium utsteinense TaxID=1960156 RepID=UPI00130031A4|nr:hypothetical protein [Abditibacterium utsteinense]